MKRPDQGTVELIRSSGLFDGPWYLNRYRDVKMLGMDPVEHYLWVGAKLGRDPGPGFSTKSYGLAYPDVAAASFNELVHFIRYGQEEGRSPRPPIRPIDHAVSQIVDIIVPVFNALPDVQRCLQSILLAKTKSQPRVIVVDDGSDEETVSWLSKFCTANKKTFTLIKHGVNKGYTIAVNAGIKYSSAPYVVLLNSDTIVTSGWLDALLRCSHSSSKIGIIGPLSNAASWQSVPTVLDETGDFSLNPLPEGFDPNAMASVITSVSQRAYPRVRFVNGFCFLITRSLINTIGLMDEHTFPQGYGEENDYCIRAHDAGFDLAIADDCYVFHAKSKSFGHERRKTLSANASRLLSQKHGREKINAFLNITKSAPQLALLREKIANRLRSQINELADVFNSRIVFLLPVRGGGGGSHSVVQEVAELRRLGVDAKVAVKPTDLQRFKDSYSSMRVDDIFISLPYPDIGPDVAHFDIVVATVYTTVDYLSSVREFNPNARLFYYVQDYEPLFFPEGSRSWHQARESYTKVSGLELFAKTHWIRNKVAQEHGVFVHKVSPSIDHSVYHPRPSTAHRDQVRISAMIRPQTPYRGAARTMRVLGRISKELAGRVEIHIFGCSAEEVSSYDLSREFSFTNRGHLKREEVADLLSTSDIFLDLSDYQAFGRTGLEAMACGCIPVVPLAGGSDEYAISGYNSEIVDTTSEEDAYQAAVRLIENDERRSRMKVAAIATAARYSTTLAAASEMQVFSEGAVHASSSRARPQLHVVSEVRGDGKPTGSAYVRLLLPYANQYVQQKWKVFRNYAGQLPSIDKSGIALVQRTAGSIQEGDLHAWIEGWKSKGNKIIYEVDDDLLDKQGLLSRGVKTDIAAMQRRVKHLSQSADLVIVSTQHLLHVFRELNPNVVVVENYLDGRLWKLNGERPAPDDAYGRQDDLVKIGYIGTPTHTADLEMISPAIRRLQAEFGDRISVEVVGAYSSSEPLFGTKVPNPKSTEYPQFVEWLLKRVHWDIGVIPLVDDRFNKSKSHLKFLEYAALDMAIVCSDVETYRRVASSGENALVVENTVEAWYQAVRRLIKDRNLRLSLAKSARAMVKASYTVDANNTEYLKALSLLSADFGENAKAS